MTDTREAVRIDVTPVAKGDLPTKYLIDGLPLEYHGPVDFPCFGAALRSMAAFDGIKVSKNTFMLPGTLRYGYTYLRGTGFVNLYPRWGATPGFGIANEFAASVAGLGLKVFDHNPDRTWEDLWIEMKGYVAAGRPVYVCFRNMELLWATVGRSLDPLWSSAQDNGAVAHCVVLVGYDEERGIATFHDNYWFFKNAGGQDIAYIDYPIDVCKEALANRMVPAPFVLTGEKSSDLSLRDTLAIQADIILGRKWNGFFEPPEYPEVATGDAALIAAADDLDAAASKGADDIGALLSGYDTVLGTEWFLGADGQPARTGWFSGIAAATGIKTIEEAAFHLDDSATQWARAKHLFQEVRAELAKDAPDVEVLQAKTRALAASFRIAGENERAAGERLEEAVAGLT